MRMQYVNSAAELVAHIPPKSRIFIHGAAATPNTVVDAVVADQERLTGCEIMHLHTHGPARYADCPGFRVTNLFVGENLRNRIDYDRVDYLPCFLSEIPLLFYRNLRRPDVAIIQVSPPDVSGFCSLGTSVDVAKAAVETASIVLAQINPQMPRTHGEGMIPVARITAAWVHSEPLTSPGAHPLFGYEEKIAEEVASLIEDGATLQMGIGAIPDSVLKKLFGHKNLGVHTEMFSDGLIPLIEKGVVTNSNKVLYPGRVVTTFSMGSPHLYRFIHDNPGLCFLPADQVNAASNIAKNPKVVAINSAVEVDLTGQVVADSVGHRVISGVGGQMDFIRGACLSPGGKAIIALPARTRKGESRLVSTLHEGAGVVTTRAHVHYVVTEFGVADLYAKTLGERAKALIEIAHPDDRELLARKWFEERRKIK